MDLIKSMTGFGRAQKVFANKEITVEIRSVNHRYFEFSARVPRAYSYLEERLKSHLKTTISRGKIEASVMIAAVEGETTMLSYWQSPLIFSPFSFVFLRGTKI